MKTDATSGDRSSCEACPLANAVKDGADNGLKITDLIDLETLQRLQDCFADATGVASVITDPEGRPLTRPSNFCRLCIDIIRKTEKGLANCMRSDAILGMQNPTGPIISPCLSGGLWDGGASICVGERHIANWLIGQIRNEETPDESILAYADQIGADREEFAKALAEVPTMPVQQFSKICNALFIIANQISDLAYKNMALKESETNLKTTLDSIGDAVIATDAENRITHMNPVAESLSGVQFKDAHGDSIDSVLKLLDAETKAPLDSPSSQAMRGISRISSNAILINKQGIQRMVSDTAAPILDGESHPNGAVVVIRDISEQRLLEEQLRQSHKMEAVGRLAGGIAHDFNNMLAGIMGAAELIAKRTEKDPSLHRLAEIALDATTRAAELTRKLLDFSRKGMRESIPLDIHQVIKSAISILERSLDRKVSIESHLGASNSIVKGDSAQLHGAILNLGINARDAMPDGGLLSITTRNINIDKEDCRFIAEKAACGEHIEISVSDTGTGMSPEVQRNIFEPFFTTKEVGKGTGLGLSSVYGTVKEHGGSILVYSEPGRGSVFKLYIPLVADNAHESKKVATEGDSCACRIGRVLLVDDEPLVREVAKLMLEELGNEVEMAQDGQAAVDLVRDMAAPFDLVLLDMIMPRMNGREAFFALEKLLPQSLFIFSSGFTKNENMDELLARPNVIDFIQKPYNYDAIRKAMEAAMRKRQEQ